MTSPTPELAIETRGLGKRFGARAALDRVDLEVPRGVAFGFLGANGAGKTTLIRLLLGLANPTSGTMRLLGHDLPAGSAAALARVGAIIEALRAGASGFLLKDAPTQEVVAAVRAVAAGDAVLAPAVTRQLLDQVGRRLPAAMSRDAEGLGLRDRVQAVIYAYESGLITPG